MNGEDDASERDVAQRLDILARDRGLRDLAQERSAPFNTFEALGEVRREARHSAFLAFLLDPRGNHGLQEAFVSCLLTEALPALRRPERPAIGPDDDTAWTVQREVPSVDPQTRLPGRIDILLLDHSVRRAIIIENKIDAAEHGEQLLRYYRDITGRYEGWEVYGLYLTPRGDDPSCGHYAAVSYRQILSALDCAVGSRGTSMPSDTRDDVGAALRQYGDMIRRHIVNEFDSDRACQRIYLQHGAAIITVQERIDVMQEAISNELVAMVQAEKRAHGETFVRVKRDRWASSPRHVAHLVYFIPQSWESINLRAGAAAPLRADSILDFQIFNWPQGVELTLKIRPGDPSVRRSLLTLADANGQSGGPLRVLDSRSQGYIRIYSRTLVPAARYAEGDRDALLAAIREEWSLFITEDLPRIDEAIRGLGTAP